MRVGRVGADRRRRKVKFDFVFGDMSGSSYDCGWDRIEPFTSYCSDMVRPVHSTLRERADISFADN